MGVDIYTPFMNIHHAHSIDDDDDADDDDDDDDYTYLIMGAGEY